MILDGVKISKLLQEQNKTQVDMCVFMNCDRPFVSWLVNEKRKQVSLCTAYKVSKFFGVTIEELIKK